MIQHKILVVMRTQTLIIGCGPILQNLVQICSRSRKKCVFMYDEECIVTRVVKITKFRNPVGSLGIRHCGVIELTSAKFYTVTDSQSLAAQPDYAEANAKLLGFASAHNL